MKKAKLIILLFFIVDKILVAQCPTTVISLNSQTEVNNFNVNYPNCTSLLNSLNISGSTIINLNPLTSIKSIAGNLNISACQNLSDVSGLDHLTNVGGRFDISNCDNLYSINGFNSLQSIGNRIRFLNCDNLQSISGFDSLLTIGSDIQIQNNPNLETLNITWEITKVFGNLTLSNNNKVLNYPMFSNITEIVGNFTLDKNSSLTTPGDFNNLQSIGGEFFVDFNLNQIDFTGLSSLNTIGQRFNVTRNALLQNFNGLNNLFNISGDFNVSHNASLQNFIGAGNLNNCGGIFYVDYNPALESFIGLYSFESIKYSFLINNNISLSSMDGLSHFTTMGLPGIDLAIASNPVLTSLDSLINLRDIGGATLTILGNNSLQTLHGIDSIWAFTIGGLYIESNPNLSYCHVKSVCDHIEIHFDGTFITNDNLTGCNSVSEVQAQCQSALPIALLKFDGIYENNACKLYWNYNADQAIEKIILEKSEDNINFYPIFQYSPTTREVSQYYDQNIKNELQYYRLKIIDYDSDFIYSSTIELNCSEFFKDKLFPIPAHDLLHYLGNNHSYIIYDQLGKVISHGSFSGTIDISALVDGYYQLKIDGKYMQFVKI